LAHSASNKLPKKTHSQFIINAWDKQAIRPIFCKALFKGEFLVHGFFLRLSELEIKQLLDLQTKRAVPLTCMYSWIA
jgi:hypothetical protein